MCVLRSIMPAGEQGLSGVRVTGSQKAVRASIQVVLVEIVLI